MKENDIFTIPLRFKHLVDREDGAQKARKKLESSLPGVFQGINISTIYRWMRPLKSGRRPPRDLLKAIEVLTWPSIEPLKLNLSYTPGVVALILHSMKMQSDGPDLRSIIELSPNLRLNLRVRDGGGSALADLTAIGDDKSDLAITTGKEIQNWPQFRADFVKLCRIAKTRTSVLRMGQMWREGDGAYIAYWKRSANCRSHAYEFYKSVRDKMEDFVEPKGFQSVEDAVIFLKRKNKSPNFLFGSADFISRIAEKKVENCTYEANNAITGDTDWYLLMSRAHWKPVIVRTLLSRLVNACSQEIYVTLTQLDKSDRFRDLTLLPTSSCQELKDSVKEWCCCDEFSPEIVELWEEEITEPIGRDDRR